MANPPDASQEPPARWQRWLHASAEALFLLSGQRRLAYANRAWEQATGLSLADVRGRACRRKPRATAVEPVDQVLSALAPPPEALQGRPCQTRRRAPGPTLGWWQIDFFPWSSAEGLLAVLGKIRVIAETGPAHGALPEKLVQLRDRFQQIYRLESWTSELPVMQRLRQQLRLAASTHLPVLIQGPAGSGKAWAARTIHQLSEQRETFFAAFDTRLPAALVAEMLSSSRHWRLGTLYIADIDRLPREAQVLLLHHLATERDDPGPRVLAGRSANPNEEVRGDHLLPELHARLSALMVQVPSLAERLADLPHLLDDVLPRAAQAVDRDVRGATPEVLELLRRHAWPGNLRELYDVLAQACRHAQGDHLAADDLTFYLRNAPAPPEKSIRLDETLEKVERRLIELALRMANQNKTRAAELLGIWRPRLLRRLEQLGMTSEQKDATVATAQNKPTTDDTHHTDE
jgi:transcriptional regulator with PAS, ATPase and Fis domain